MSHPHPRIPGTDSDSGIAGIGSDSGVANRNHTILLTHICDVVLISYSVWTRSNSVTEFRELRQDGIPRNSHRFRNSGNWFQIRNCTEFLPIPEIDRTRSIFEWVSDVMCRSSSRNWTESIPVRNWFLECSTLRNRMTAPYTCLWLITL